MIICSRALSAESLLLSVSILVYDRDGLRLASKLRLFLFQPIRAKIRLEGRSTCVPTVGIKRERVLPTCDVDILDPPVGFGPSSVNRSPRILYPRWKSVCSTMDRPLLVNEFEDMGLTISDDMIDECKYMFAISHYCKRWNTDAP